MSARVFVIVGAKGGVGATTIAAKLVQRFPTHGDRMIVDADLSGKRSLGVWYDVTDELDLAREVGSVAVATSKAGPLVMELARTYEDGLVQTTPSIVRAIGHLSENALIVVDAPQPLAATVRPFIVRAAKIVVLTEPTPIGVGVAGTVLAALDRAGIPASRVALVLNDIPAKGSMPRAEIERALGMPVSAELTNERDRKFKGLFDGFMTMLAAASVLELPDLPGERPVFDRRLEQSDALQ